MYLQHVAESMQAEHKARKRSQPEITTQYLNLINHYVDTVFILSDLEDRQRTLSWDIGKYLENLHKLT